MFDSFLDFDLKVFEWIQSIQNEVLNYIMLVITTLGDAGIIFIIIGLGLFLTKKNRKAGFTMLIALLVMLICNDLFLKEFFARPRPFDLFGTNQEKYAFWNEVYTYPHIVTDMPDSFSFPSGHTSSAFAAAVALLWNDRKKGIPLTIFAAIMGFSRIYVEVHYCTDVIAGVVSGTICAFIGVLIVKFLFPYVEKGMNKLEEKTKKKKASVNK